VPRENLFGDLYRDWMNYRRYKDAKDWREEDLTRQDLRQGYDAAREAMRLESAGGEFDPERIQDVGRAAFDPWISQYPDQSEALAQWVESVASSYVPSERARMGQVLESARQAPFIGEDPQLAQAGELLRAAGLEETLGPGEMGPRKPPVDYTSATGEPIGRQLQPNMARILDVSAGQRQQDWAQGAQERKFEDSYKQFMRPDGSIAHVVELPDPVQPGRYVAYEIPGELVDPQNLTQMMRMLQNMGTTPAGIEQLGEMTGDPALSAAARAAGVEDSVADTLAQPESAAPTPPSQPGTPPSGFTSSGFPQAPVGGIGGWETSPAGGLTNNQGMGRVLYVRTPQGMDWGAGGGEPLQAMPTPQPEPDPATLHDQLFDIVTDPELGTGEGPLGIRTVPAPGSTTPDPLSLAPLLKKRDPIEGGPFPSSSYPWTYQTPGSGQERGGIGRQGSIAPTPPDVNFIGPDRFQEVVTPQLPRIVHELQQRRAAAQQALESVSPGTDWLGRPGSIDKEYSSQVALVQALTERLQQIESVWGEANAAGWELGDFPSPAPYATGTPSGAPFAEEPLGPTPGSGLPEVPSPPPPEFMLRPDTPGVVPGQQLVRTEPLPGLSPTGGLSALPTLPPGIPTDVTGLEQRGLRYDPEEFPRIQRESLPPLPPGLDFLKSWQPATASPPGMEQFIAEGGGPPFTQPPPLPPAMGGPLAATPHLETPQGLPRMAPLPTPGMSSPDVDRRGPRVETSQGTAMPDKYQDELRDASTRWDVPPALLTALAQEENANFHPKAQARAMDPKEFTDRLDMLKQRVQEQTGRTLEVKTRLRDLAQQQEAYESGASPLSGLPGEESAHQSNLAADIYFVNPSGGILENDAEVAPYHILGEVAEELGLRWGGRWKKRDFGHVEAPPTGVGLWQVNPTTAADPGYGLNETFKDLMADQGGETAYERAFNALLDPAINAQMAAAYLNALYKETGDWGQALASYVMGPAAAQDQNWKAQPKILNYVTSVLNKWGGGDPLGVTRRGGISAN
jgi:hypothetical protein